MRSLLVVLSLLLLAAATPARAAETDCTPERAARMSFHDAYWYEGPDICVRLQGLIAWRVMYASTKAYYEQRHLPHYTEREVIGIYGDSDELWRMRRVVDATGLLTNCRRMYDRALARQSAASKGTITIVMMSGSCHYRGGPTLIVNAYTPLPDAPTRLAGAYNASLYGDLLPVDPNAAQREAAQTWFIALAARDDATLGKLEHIPADSERMRVFLDPAHSTYAAVFGRSPLPPLQWFQPTARMAESLGNPIYACICVRGDCHDEWPINGGDVGPQSDPPFRCAVLRRDAVEDAW